MDIRLIIQSGDRINQQIPIDVHEFIIGRDADCHHRIDHPMVNPRHAKIHLFGGRVSITDLKTENGTAVNDKYVRDVELKDGDRIKIGPTNFLCAIMATPKDLDRRVEFWCASTLEARSRQVLPSDTMESLVESMPAEAARKILGKLTSREGTVGGRARLRVGESGGVTVVKFVDNALVQDTDIQEVEQELVDLIDSGRRRLVMNFGNLENMSSQVANVLMTVHKLCAERGGRIKICKLGSKVGSMFTMLGLHNLLEILPDERTALMGEWPDGPADEPIHDAIAMDEIPLDFMPMASVAGNGPGDGNPSALLEAPAPSTVATVSALAPAPRAAPTSAALTMTAIPAAATRVGLVVQGGKADGKMVDIQGQRFFIGGDASCQLRPKSPQVGPMHAVIERRQGRVYVRDLGWAGGTRMGDQTLNAREVEANHGDRLQVGPLAFVFSIQAEAPRPSPAVSPSGTFVPPPPPPETVDDMAASWLFQGAPPLTDVAAEVNKRLAKFANVAPMTSAPEPPPKPVFVPDVDREDEAEDDLAIPEAPAPARTRRVSEIAPPGFDPHAGPDPPGGTGPNPSELGPQRREHRGPDPLGVADSL